MPAKTASPPSGSAPVTSAPAASPDPLQPELSGLRALHSSLRAQAAGELEGIYGPESVSWRILREVALFGVGGRALLLQFAHPAVATGVSQHSQYQDDLLGRTQRTFIPVYQSIFGDLQSALSAGERVFHRHGPVRGQVPADTSSPEAGTAYSANEPRLLFWVLATLIDSVLIGYQAFVGPLTPAEQAQYYLETRLNAQLYGIPEHHIPKTLEDFRAYFRATMEDGTLAVGDQARSLYRSLFKLESPLGAGIQMYELLAAGFMPPSLRLAYGMPWSATDPLRFRVLTRLTREIIVRLPAGLRYVPLYHEGMARVARGRGEDVGLELRASHYLSQLLEVSALLYLKLLKPPNP